MGISANEGAYALLNEITTLSCSNISRPGFVLCYLSTQFKFQMSENFRKPI